MLRQMKSRAMWECGKGQALQVVAAGEAAGVTSVVTGHRNHSHKAGQNDRYEGLVSFL